MYILGAEWLQNIYNSFMSEISDIINESDFNIISSVIHKEKLIQTSLKNDNPYHIALAFCLERLNKFLSTNNNENKTIHIIVEKRGKKEDDELELEFRRICQDKNYKFNIILADKKINSVGLQLSDMIARPIGRHLLNPKEDNRAYSIIEKKLIGYKISKDLGLKIYP